MSSLNEITSAPITLQYRALMRSDEICSKMAEDKLSAYAKNQLISNRLITARHTGSIKVSENIHAINFRKIIKTIIKSLIGKTYPFFDLSSHSFNLNAGSVKSSITTRTSFKLTGKITRAFGDHGYPRGEAKRYVSLVNKVLIANGIQGHFTALSTGIKFELRITPIIYKLFTDLPSFKNIVKNLFRCCLLDLEEQPEVAANGSA